MRVYSHPGPPGLASSLGGIFGGTEEPPRILTPTIREPSPTSSSPSAPASPYSPEPRTLSPSPHLSPQLHLGLCRSCRRLYRKREVGARPPALTPPHVQSRRDDHDELSQRRRREERGHREGSGLRASSSEGQLHQGSLQGQLQQGGLQDQLDSLSQAVGPLTTTLPSWRACRAPWWAPRPPQASPPSAPPPPQEKPGGHL